MAEVKVIELTGTSYQVMLGTISSQASSRGRFRDYLEIEYNQMIGSGHLGVAHKKE
jgi:hypothetical protein